MSASFSASASFTPSPVIATTCARATWSALTIARFCCGVTRPKTDVRLEHLGELVVVVGQLARVERLLGARQAQRAARSRRRSRGWSPRDHLHRHALLARSTRAWSRRLADARSASDHERDGDEPLRSASPFVDRGRRLRPSRTTRRPASAWRRRAVATSSWRRPASRGARRARRAPTSPASSNVDPAPLARRRERDRVEPARQPVRGVGEALARSRASWRSGEASAAASAASACAVTSASAARAARPRRPTSRPSVSVPVLSMHSTSTRASTLDRRQLLHEHAALARAGRRRPRTRRSSAARDPRAPSRRCRPPHRRRRSRHARRARGSWLTKSSAAVGTIAHVTSRRIVVDPDPELRAREA